MKYYFSTYINRAPDDVFAYLVDPARLPAWLETITAVRHRPPGPLRVGSTIIKTRQTQLGLLTYTNRVTELDHENRVFGQRTIDSLIRGTTGRYTVVPAGSGSELRNEIDVQVSGLGKLIAPWLARSAKQETQRGQDRLKALLEGRR